MSVPIFSNFFETSFITRDVCPFLIRVCKSTHTGHNAKDIVVSCVDVDESSCGCTFLVDECVRADGQLESGIVDTGEIACAGRLVLFRFQTEGVHANTLRHRPISVVLVDLDKVEVTSGTLSETILSVELEFGDNSGVAIPGLTDASGGAEISAGATIKGSIIHGISCVHSVEDGELEIGPLITDVVIG